MSNRRQKVVKGSNVAEENESHLEGGDSGSQKQSVSSTLVMGDY